MIMIWEKFVKVWTNFGNLIKILKVVKKILKDFKKILIKIWKKFNEKIQFFLLSILILSALKNLCSGRGGRSLGPQAATVYITPEI